MSLREIEMPQTQQPILTREEVQYILEGVQPASLTRDELEHALTVVFGWTVEEDDRDQDLVEYLQACLVG